MANPHPRVILDDNENDNNNKKHHNNNNNNNNNIILTYNTYYMRVHDQFRVNCGPTFLSLELDLNQCLKQNTS